VKVVQEGTGAVIELAAVFLLWLDLVLKRDLGLVAACAGQWPWRCQREAGISG
jgi:hypothetical protein